MKRWKIKFFFPGMMTSGGLLAPSLF